MYRNIIYTGYDNILDIALTVSGIVLVNKDMQTVTLLGDARNQFPFLLEGADWAETVHMGAKLLRVGVGKSKGSYGLCYIIYDFSPTASGQQMGIGGPSKGLNISIKSMSSRGGSLIELGDTNVDDVKVYAGISRGVVLIKNVLKYVFDAHRSFPVGDFPVREISYVESNPNSSNDMAYIIYVGKDGNVYLSNGQQYQIIPNFNNLVSGTTLNIKSIEFATLNPNNTRQDVVQEGLTIYDLLVAN